MSKLSLSYAPSLPSVFPVPPTQLLLAMKSELEEPSTTLGPANESLLNWR